MDNVSILFHRVNVSHAQGIDMQSLKVALAGLALASAPVLAEELPMDRPLRPDETAFRALYKEMVETDTSITTGSCTALAQKVAAHLKKAGFSDKEVSLFSVPDHPKEGGLTARLDGTSKTEKPILLLGHIDVVAAKPEDWTRNPFTLIEENNYFYGRGTADMKALDAIWVDLLERWKKEGYHPKRTVKLALTCGEETTDAFNGADWLARNKKDAVDAAFALNEGGGGRTDGHGKLTVENIQVGEKKAQNYRIEATNPGGHSSIPIKDNAIYELADAITKIRDYEFPVKMTDTTRTYFAEAGKQRGGEMGDAMVALSKNPDDKAAEAIVSTDRAYHSMLRTTCVATLLDGGHAENALPQRAGANINCRIFPGETVEGTMETLAKVINDPKIAITANKQRGPVAVPPPLDPKVIEPAKALVAKYYPGVPLIPTMSTGATDGVFLEAVGIPVYGVPGSWGDPDGNGVHGLNERKGVRSVYIARDFLTELVKSYAEAE
jgi:acetylornithine deacetylase/succinyl-diaminopimelate desuccinylase-like protein